MLNVFSIMINDHNFIKARQRYPHTVDNVFLVQLTPTMMCTKTEVTKPFKFCTFST